MVAGPSNSRFYEIVGSRDRAATPSIGYGNRETVVRGTTFM